MVQLSRQDSPVVYLFLDGERPIGQVVAPTGEPALGRGAGTVLLQRGGGMAADAGG
ncbi:MAG TPA: hypothetical protein VMY76_16460 [Gemmatimonadales bacterium]|nr:hypothetical protein [Gemmatimonadales bacterium]